MTDKIELRTTGCENDYADAISARTVFAGDVRIGDLVNFNSRTPAEFASSWAAILTVAMRPYSNGTFATREGALKYMALVAYASHETEDDTAYAEALAVMTSTSTMTERKS
jgi:hypothetical protein